LQIGNAADSQATNTGAQGEIMNGSHFKTADQKSCLAEFLRRLILTGIFLDSFKQIECWRRSIKRYLVEWVGSLCFVALS
jgi:hypothetical protein